MNSTLFTQTLLFGTKNGSSAKEKNRKSVITKIKKRKPEIIAWALFFGVGVAYFISTLIIAIV
ncbi:MAG: hypothetical protein IPM77_13345 [Crocinitomicaceae bacterium]|nr:hypothetical protein [Crocinitomicaceae bacterium]